MATSERILLPGHKRKVNAMGIHGQMRSAVIKQPLRRSWEECKKERQFILKFKDQTPSQGDENEAIVPISAWRNLADIAWDDPSRVAGLPR
jgi:hypothetical protein